MWSRIFISLIILWSLNSCVTKDVDFTPESELVVGQYIPEDFSNLPISTLQTIETPYAEYFQKLESGRTLSSHISFNKLTDRFKTIFPGVKILNYKSEEFRGLDIWKTTLLMSGGGIMKVMISREITRIIEIEGQSAPFAYVVDPGGGFFSMNEALNKAFNIQEGELIRWELELEEDTNWEYEIHLKEGTSEWEIEFDALSGEFLGINLKEEEHRALFETPSDPAPSNFLEAARQLIDGDIIHSNLSSKTEPAHWQIFIETVNGAIVEIIIDAATRELLRAEGYSPLTTEFDPGNELVALGHALEEATAFEEGELEKWELILQNDGTTPSNWIYEITLRNESNDVSRVNIEASTGKVKIEITEELLPPEVLNRISEIIEGEVINWSEKQKQQIDSWEILVETPAGGLVEVNLVQNDDLDIISIEGKTTPFDYEVTPGNGFISFVEAKQIALDTLPETIEKWALKIPPNPNESGWIYEFKMTKESGIEIKIEIDALTGSVLIIKDDNSDNPNDPPVDVPDALTMAISQIVDGTITDVKELTVEGVASIRVTVETATGALVQVTLAMENLDFIKGSGEEGPFDYDFNPGNGLIVFGAVKIIAENEQEGVILEWTLKYIEHPNDPSKSSWRYEFVILTSGNEEVAVLINAETGEIL